MVSIQLDKEHGYVMLIVAGSFILNMWQMIMVKKLQAFNDVLSFVTGWESEKAVQCDVPQDVRR